MRTAAKILIAGGICLAVSFITGLGAVRQGGSASSLELEAELERRVLPADLRQNALIKVTITAPELNLAPDKRKFNVNLAVVIDKSGSMNSGNKIENAKEAAITALRMLEPNNIFSLITYDDQARTIVPPTLVNNKKTIEEKIRGIRASGSTCLFAGVSVGANEIRKNISERCVNRIVLLSDGLANVGPDSPAEMGRLGVSLIKEGISVSAVGVGDDYDEDILTALAQNSDGNFYFVENSRDLLPIFSRELGSALNVAAKSINIHIECPQGVKPQGILGHDCRINGNSIDLFFNQVYGGHAKSLIFQIEVPPNAPDKKITVASLRMNYKDAESGKKYSAERMVSVSFSKNKNLVAESYNTDVLNEVALQNNVILKEEAIKQADKGNLKEASQLLHQAAEQLEKTSQITGDINLKKEAERSKNHAEDIEGQAQQGSFSKSSRKQLRGESYQEKNKQYYKQ